jgi:hypothetical protein
MSDLNFNYDAFESAFRGLSEYLETLNCGDG